MNQLPPINLIQEADGHMHVMKHAKDDYDADRRSIYVKEATLDKMISLAMVNSSTGPIKKMMHVPSCNIYAVKEIPIKNRDVRNRLKKLISDWENLLNRKVNPHLVGIIDTHWNTPEGCLSVVMENMSGGSLLVTFTSLTL